MRYRAALKAVRQYGLESDEFLESLYRLALVLDKYYDGEEDPYYDFVKTAILKAAAAEDEEDEEFPEERD